jgi:hypothetical protein
MFGSRSYDTTLTASQEAAFQAWRAALPKDLQNTTDYDLRGAYLASAQADGRDHMTDQFKKPNHITFSDGSQYSTPETPGGHWSGAGERWAYWPSDYVAGQHTMQDLADYFARNEKGSAVIYPSDYRMPGRGGKR